MDLQALLHRLGLSSAPVYYNEVKHFLRAVISMPSPTKFIIAPSGLKSCKEASLDFLLFNWGSELFVFKSSHLNCMPKRHCLLQITAQGFVVHSADEQLPFIRSCYGGADDYLAVISVHLSHRWLIGMNVLDPDDLKETQSWQCIIWTVDAAKKKEKKFCFCLTTLQKTKPKWTNLRSRWVVGV